MSTTTSTAISCPSRRAILLARLADYFELSKPRIGAMVLVVVAVSACVAGWGPPPPWLLVNTLVGTALVAASASAFNQLLERRSDLLMTRTSARPLPAARLTPAEAAWFGVVTLAGGLAILAALVNPTTALVGFLTWFIYVAMYTPLKSRSSANTAIGAVSGALPVLIGWASVGASFSLAGAPYAGGVRAAALFLIVYLWQFPHFMAIAWIYRNQYGAAGLQMLTVVDSSGRRAGAQAVMGALALLPISLLPALSVGGPAYWIGALALGSAYLAASIAFCIRRDEPAARGLLQASLAYLPLLLVLLVLAPLT